MRLQVQEHADGEADNEQDGNDGHRDLKGALDAIEHAIDQPALSTTREEAVIHRQMYSARRSTVGSQ